MLINDVISGKVLPADDILGLVEKDSYLDLFQLALKVKKHFSGDSVDLCSIINARSGACPEDCSYCAQSSRSRADIPVYPLLESDDIIEKAREIKDKQVKRFCIVTSGKRVHGEDLGRIAKIIKRIREIGILPCATLGLLDRDDLKLLRDHGLERYHHNLETSERFFPNVCSTHTYADKIRTVEAVKEVGLSLCCGGLFGMGETWQDRIDMAFAIRDLGVDSVPVNFLTPISGTPLQDMAPIEPIEALKIISLYRLVLPDRQVRVCGGRLQTLGELNPLVFLAGADGLLVGNYLTTPGRDIGHDIEIINALGFRPY
ncbi:biotin synthase [bacterium BMS3Abin07]|nr:biotin synthase [bacterium BMS3Abin07]GBE32664.1 biotin synthase [bacterium BMS3Bbin05]